MIPVFEPDLGDDELAAVATALRQGEISGSFGSFIPEFERRFADYCGSRYGVAVSSGTAALHLAVAAAGVGAGDEVLVSASTNVATALAPYHHGAVPVPVDSEERTWNLDLDRIEPLVTTRTRAIIAVHLYGHPVDMDRLCALAARHRLIVIEDCAEAHGATCRGRKVGTFGAMGCFSFYANKIITTGEGGMVVTDDAALAERVRLLRNLAFTEPRFRHEIAGYNFRMTGMQAALGVAQCKRLETIIAEKRHIAQTYNRLLAGHPKLRLPPEEAWARSVYWMYAVVLRDADRGAVTAALRRDGIDTRTFFCPMNQQPFLKKQPGYREVACPVADRLWETGLYLPSSLRLDEHTLTHIANRLLRALESSPA